MPAVEALSTSQRLAGRMFVHPLFDYLLIGGGLSLLVVAAVAGGGLSVESLSGSQIVLLVLLSNSAHFASSTVRLYTKPNSLVTMPVLTAWFPGIALAVLLLGFTLFDIFGRNLWHLYLTWSPYHYAAQAYGIAVMYSYRSGCKFSPLAKRLLWWVAMIPFFYNMVTSGEAGAGWLFNDGLYAATAQPRLVLSYGLLTLGLLTPLLLFGLVARSRSGPMPLIALLAIYTNGIWFFFLPSMQAFVWATIFHGIQYLAIVIIFHLKDQLSREGNRRGPVFHVLWFYGASLLLGYGLFNCLPEAFRFAGLNVVEASMLVVTLINLHHFIVDGYIWRLGKRDTNRRVVESGPGAAVAVAVR